MGVVIRPEGAADAAAVRSVTAAAFRAAPHASGTEAAIVDALRAAGALSVSLVAEEGGAIIGHVAFSPVTIEGQRPGWYGLGPVSVHPDRQGLGTGSRLIRCGLERLRTAGAQGCVVLGDPRYYGRFGFRPDAALTYLGAPSEYFQCLSFRGSTPVGIVTYHPAFMAA
jgi:putative acetyltransferase